MPKTPSHIHIGIGLCGVCNHYGKDCTGRKLRGAEKRREAEQCLERRDRE